MPGGAGFGIEIRRVAVVVRVTVARRAGPKLVVTLMLDQQRAVQVTVNPWAPPSGAVPRFANIRPLRAERNAAWLAGTVAPSGGKRSAQGSSAVSLMAEAIQRAAGVAPDRAAAGDRVVRDQPGAGECQERRDAPPVGAGQ